jgi:hemolysin activation/secretion protein
MFFFVLLPGIVRTAAAADEAVSNSVPVQRTIFMGTPISAEEMEQARDALHRKMAELNSVTNTAAGEMETNAEPLTVKLILASPASEGPPADPREALRRRFAELDDQELASDTNAVSAGAATNPAPAKVGPVFQVSAYEVAGIPALATNTFAPLFARYIGTNVSLEEILKAASDLQREWGNRGFPSVSVAVAPKQFTNGVVVLNVFEAVSPQILVAGQRYAAPVAASTNPPPAFAVRGYEIAGDTLLSDATLRSIFVKYTGTNIGVPEILKAGSELQLEYRDRGFPTVNVTIPPQQITNGLVKIRVFEGRLTSIVVTNNQYFSADNVLRSLPGLKTNEILVGPVFQAELDRANNNQDRQIYPQIAPGPRENTSELVLNVKDRMPLHAKTEFNNDSSPGTPALRLNTSAAYNNLWQLEHSLGLQYSFSPSEYKTGDQWNLYDRPLVANYSTFYRLPLGDSQPIEQNAAASSTGFGYDEATRKFRLPSPSGRPELNIYASRSTIDTGLQTIFRENNSSSDTNGIHTFNREDVQQDLTVNNDVGARLSVPMPPRGDWQSAFSFGGEYKTYHLESFKTNTFTITDISFDEAGRGITNIDRFVSPVNTNTGFTLKSINYLPLSVHFDGSLRDRLGTTSFGLGLSFNPWCSVSTRDLQAITGSTNSSRTWFIVTPSVTRDFLIHTNWTLSLHLDGQLASSPLISNEQYGAGGVNSVRGYREGEVFGDDGWHLSVEQKTPTCLIGLVGGNQPLTVRGSVYMDYAEVYLLDPLGRQARTPLWGIGAGAVISVGTHWDARFLFSLPLITAGSTEAYHPRFNFALTGQF